MDPDEFVHDDGRDRFHVEGFDSIACDEFFSAATCSQTRLEIFEYIRQKEERGRKIDKQAEIAREVSCSPPAVTNGLNSLREYGYVERSDTVRLSFKAKLLDDPYTELTRRVTVLDEYEEFFSQISDDGELNLSEILTDLTGAEIAIETDKFVQSVEDYYQELIDESDSVKEIVHDRTAKAESYRDQMLKGQIDGEFIINSHVKDKFLADPEQKDFLEDVEQYSDAFLERPMPDLDFTLAIFDEKVAFIVKDDDFVILSTDSESVRRWAENNYEKYEERSTEFEFG